MSTISEINAAIETRLNTLVGKPDIAWPNVAYEPDPTSSYFIPFIIPGIPVKIGVADSDLFIASSNYNITICTPKGNGAKTAIDYADLIKQHFPVGLELTTPTKSYKLRIKSVRMELGEVAGSHFCVPVLIEFEHIND
jgi:hypothetical protein